MPDSASFQQLIARVRTGDPQASQELVDSYGSHIRRVLRFRLPSGHPMRRVVDSDDIYQSVFGDFFLRARMGQFDLETPENLLGLLCTMTRNKCQRRIDEDHTQKRGGGRKREFPSSWNVEPAADTSTASQIVMRNELVDQCRRRMTDDERNLIDQRAAGRSWADLAQELGLNVDAVRMRHRRIIDRLCEELGLESSCDGQSE